MKLITLNTWGGRAGLAPLLNFFEKYNDVDVFCLQEIWQGQPDESSDQRIVNDLLLKIASRLTDFNFYFRPQFRNIYGLATFVRKNIPVLDEGEVFVFKEQGFENPVAMGNHARNIQYVTVRAESGPLTIVNFHGLWNGMGKTDTDDRILQSNKIAEFLKSLKNPYILAGDFNLVPDTRSFKILSDISRDLIGEYGVTSTRSSHYPKPEKFADYILTSEDIQTDCFKVLPEEVSDHLALYASIV